MGRHGKPLKFIVADKKSHTTKAERQERAEIEALLTADGNLICPAEVKNNFHALKKWREITRIYKEKTFISSQDAGNLARYSLTYAEWLDLVEQRKAYCEHTLDWTAEIEIEGGINRSLEQKASEQVWKQFQRMMSLKGLFDIDGALNEKSRVMTALEDRLFLNPKSRAGNIQKPKKEPENPLESAGFGGL